MSDTLDFCTKRQVYQKSSEQENAQNKKIFKSAKQGNLRLI